MKKTLLVVVPVLFAVSSSAFGQIPANTVFFNFDFTANDQIGSATDVNGVFTEGPMSDGPFTDGNLVAGPEVGGGFERLAGQQSFNGTAAGIWTVDTSAGTASSAGPNGFFLNANIFKGQPLISPGDTVRLEMDVSFTKDLVNGEETDSANFLFFGFRGGAGGGEFQPNDGISLALAYDAGAGGMPANPNDSNIQARLVANATTADESLLVNVEAAGMDFSMSDFSTDILTVRSDAKFINDDPLNGATFEVSTTLFNNGIQLGTSVVSTATDLGITTAGNRIQFALRDGSPGVTDLNIHRLAAIFNPTPSVVPEPSSVLLMALAGLARIARRHR